MSDFLSTDDAIAAIEKMDVDPPQADETDVQDEVTEKVTDEVVDEASDEVEEEDTAEDEVQTDAEDESDDPDEDTGADDEEEADGESETTLEVPSFLDEKEREAFAALSPEAQKATTEIVTRQHKAFQADYTRKSQAIAEERKGVDNLKTGLENRISKLGAVVTEAEQWADYYAKMDWPKMAQEMDAEEYNQHRALAEQYAKTAQQQGAKLKAIEAEQFNSFVEEQTALMPTIAEELGQKEFLDPDAGEKVWKPLAGYLLKSGFSEDDIRHADARMSVIARKAMLYDEQEAKRKEKPALKPKPDAKSKGKAVRPAARVSSSKRAPNQAALKRFQKDGNKDDAIKLLEQFD